MLDIGANDQHFPISLDPETIRSAGMVVPLSGHYRVHIINPGEVFAGISNLQELEIGPHVIQLDREIFHLHLDFENLPQIGDCLVAAERQERDFLFGIISRGKERKALDVVPVKVRERDNDLFLLVADGAKVSAQISQSRARVNDGDAVRVCERDLQARGVATELLKTGIADGDGSARTIKLELHRIVLMKLSPNRAEGRTISHSAGRYLLNNFFFAAASSLSLSSPTSGYSKSRSTSVSITAAPTTTRVNHLLSAGTTYHGASFVAVP
jgi:hypothetical protein